jgi:hypothetical protein
VGVGGGVAGGDGAPRGGGGEGGRADHLREQHSLIKWDVHIHESKQHPKLLNSRIVLFFHPVFKSQF